MRKRKVAIVHSVTLALENANIFLYEMDLAHTHIIEGTWLWLIQISLEIILRRSSLQAYDVCELVLPKGKQSSLKTQMGGWYMRASRCLGGYFLESLLIL